MWHHLQFPPSPSYHNRLKVQFLLNKNFTFTIETDFFHRFKSHEREERNKKCQAEHDLPLICTGCWNQINLTLMWHTQVTTTQQSVAHFCTNNNLRWFYLWQRSLELMTWRSTWAAAVHRADGADRTFSWSERIGATLGSWMCRRFWVEIVGRLRLRNQLFRGLR